jgi:uncharacterized membrane protein YtjA (UPF0391 family)
MLSWIVTFMVLALFAALLGFGGVAGAAPEIARVLFFVFLVGVVIAGAFRMVVGRVP